MASYLEGKIGDGGTPFGLSFTHGTAVDVKEADGLEWNTIWTDKGLRFVTSQQIKDHIVDLHQDPETPEQEEAEIAALIQRILGTSNGLLVDPYPVEPVTVRGFPLDWKGIPVIVAANSPTADPQQHDRYWWAEWYVWSGTDPKIYVQTQVARAMMYEDPRAREADFEDTFSHEDKEWRTALRYAKARYTGASILQMEGLSVQFGGVAHMQTPDVKEYPSEAAYNRSFEADLRRLGLV